MHFEPSKVPGLSIVPLRCEICYGSIEGSQPMLMLVDTATRSSHQVHTKCYDDNDPKYIIDRIENVGEQTKNDSDNFKNMEKAADA